MKTAELREIIQGHSRDKLEKIIVELYKAIPKGIREAKAIDSVVVNPAAGRPKPADPIARDLDDIRYETEEFLSNAYNQFYFAPNSIVPKSKRPGWRFTARRLFKELQQAADNQDDAPAALGLLKKLYTLLCYSCGYILFSGSDPFDSVGIPQVDFFRAVLDIAKKVEPPREFVRKSILLALSNGLNTHTLWDGLLEVVVANLDTVDTKEIAIHTCDDLRKDAAAGNLSDIAAFSKRGGGYRATEFVNNMAVMGWMCHMELEQPHYAARYFLRHYAERNPEITLYVLLRMIEHRGSWGLWIRTYEEGIARGIRPRDELQRRFVKLRDERDQSRRSDEIVP